MIYLLRHGQTVWNAERRIQGRLDSPLTPLGIAQAKALGLLLARELPKPADFRIVASPQGRAWQTAVIVAGELGLPVSGIAHDERLMEQEGGRWQGRHKAELEAEEPELWQSYHADKWHRQLPGGESYGDVSARIAGWLDEVAESDRVIAVCHGVVSRVMRGLYGDLPRQVMLDLSERQDQLYRLSGGSVETLTAAAAEP